MTKHLIIPAVLCLLSLSQSGTAQDITHHQTEAQRAADAPYSEAVTVGNTVYLSGQVPRAPEGQLPPDIQGQTRLVMNQVRALAEKYGSSMERIAKCTVFLTDIREWATFNEVYKTYFPNGKRPARSAYEVGGLGYGYKVEVECIAVKG